MKKMEFSKLLLLQESALVWIVTLSFVVLAFFSVYKGYNGNLPWITTLTSAVWAAYGVS